MTFNLPNLREATPAAASKAHSHSTRQPSRSSTSTRHSDSSSMDEKKEAQQSWMEVRERDSNAKKSKLSRIVQAIKDIEPPEPVLPEGRRQGGMPAWGR